MRFLMNKKLWLLTIVALVPISIVALRPRPRSPLSDLPPVIIWAWERPEKLDFINTDQVGVAFLAKTIGLEAGRVVSKPRLQPLELPPGTKLIAVVRIESDHPTLSSTQLQETADEIVSVSALSNVTMVQIDFEDRKSTRLNSSHLVISYAVFC